ncbi:MAG TPA: cytochrome c, partial [Vicinamibacterales bacterium]
MWRKLAVAAVAVLALVSPLTLAGQGQRTDTTDVTFSKDVAPILYENCVYCHRPGEIAPMSLLTYQNARPWARAIKQEVLQRRMPPWKADPHYGEFRNDKMLSEQQIQTLVRWVDGGATEGNPADMPSPPEFADGWQIGTPDLVLTMAEPFTVPASGTIPWTNLPS